MQLQLQDVQNELTDAHEQHNEALTKATHAHTEAITALQTQHADKVHDIEESLSTAVTKNETLRMELIKLEESHGALQASYTALQSECDQLKQQADATTETSAIIATLQRKLSDVTALRLSESTNATAAYTELQTQLTSLQNEKDTSQTAIRESGAQYVSKLSAIEAGKQQWYDKALQYESTAAESSKLHQEQIDELQSQLDADNSAAAIELQTLHDKLKAAIHDNEALEASIADIRDNHEQSITATAAQTADQIAQLDDKIQKLQSELSESVEQKHTIELQLKHVVTEREHAIVIQQLNNKVSVLETEIIDLQAANEAMVTSAQSSTDETVVTLQQQLATAVATAETTDATVVVLNKQIEDLTGQLQQCTTMYESAIHDRDSMHATIANMQLEVTSLHGQLASAIESKAAVETSLVEARN
eukprot:8712-Heterococcus_DN1.PRE.1